MNRKLETDRVIPFFSKLKLILNFRRDIDRYPEFKHVELIQNDEIFVTRGRGTHPVKISITACKNN